MAIIDRMVETITNAKIDMLEKQLKSTKEENRIYRESFGPLMFHTKNWVMAFTSEETSQSTKTQCVVDLLQCYNEIEQYPEIRHLQYQGNLVLPPAVESERFSILEF